MRSAPTIDQVACTSSEPSVDPSSLGSEPIPRKPSTTGKTLECDVPGCDYKKKFARKYELKRHIASKHGSVRTFSCAALGCFQKGTSRRTFSRGDKLTDHIRAVHDHNTSFSGCPMNGCNLGPQPLDVLGVHLRRAHNWSPIDEADARVIRNATDTKVRRCPMSGCHNRLFLLDHFLAHLKTHDPKDLRAARSNACFEGIFFDFVTIAGATGAVQTGVNMGFM